jgi:uncharacterized protein
MKCPTCKDTSLVMSERKGIEIGYCPDCRGIWLDRGELDKIVEKSKAEDVPQVRHESSSHHGSKHSGGYEKPYKKRKSLLEELFD